MIQELLTSGHIADVILAGLALEAIALWYFVQDRTSPLHLSNIWANLAAGACFAMGLRLVLTSAGWQALAVVLALALVAHVVDLVIRSRWRQV